MLLGIGSTESISKRKLIFVAVSGVIVRSSKKRNINKYKSVY